MTNNQLLSCIVANFIKALSHKLRTPLSVISNDLSYFMSINEEYKEEFERPFNRVKEISSFLKEIVIPNSKDDIIPINLKEIINQKIDSGIFKNCNDFFINFHSSQINFFILHLSKLIKEIKKGNIIFTTEKNSSILKINIEVNREETINSMFLSEIINSQLGINSVSAPLLDLLFAYNNLKTNVILKNKTITISIYNN